MKDLTAEGVAKVYAFNRRTVEDQTLYVEAKTIDEAWRKARSGAGVDTLDVVTLKVTLRRLPAEDGDIQPSRLAVQAILRAEGER